MSVYLLLVLGTATLVGAGCGGGKKAIKTTTGRSPAVALFSQLPASAFPAAVARGLAPDTGTLTFRMTFLGHSITLTAAAMSSAQGGGIGTVTRTGTSDVLRFQHLSYRVNPIRLPDGLTVARQTITLDPSAPSTLTLDRQTGGLTGDVHWIVDAPNALYNGSHTVSLLDRGQRQFQSFHQIGPGRYGFDIRSVWHGSVVLARWSVAGKGLPGGTVSITGTWIGNYVLDVRH